MNSHRSRLIVRAHYSGLLVTLVVLIGAYMSAQQPCHADNANPGSWCSTHERWLAHTGGTTDRGGCPPEGNCDLPAVRDAAAPQPGDLLKVIRIHFIIYYENDGSNPSATVADVDAQAQILNDAFTPLGMRFIHTVSHVNDSTARHGSNYHVHAVNPATQCNIHIVESGSSSGTFPWWSIALTQTGGITMSEFFFSPAHIVTIHEMGHTLGLWHTHHGVDEVSGCGGCHERADGIDGDTTGDRCSDTPATPANFGDCFDAPGNDDCIGVPWGDTLPENYMSYGSPEGITCWESFTAQQVARMHCWVETELSSWLACTDTDDCNNNGTPDSCDILEGTSPDANLNGVPDECEGCTADITDSKDGLPDGEVNVFDLLTLLANWNTNGTGAGIAEPLNVVNVFDLLELLKSWGSCD